MRRFKGDAHKINGLKVEVRNGNVDRALKKLSKKVNEDGRLKDYGLRREFQKPSMKKKLDKKRAIKRREKQLREEEKRLRNFD